MPTIKPKLEFTSPITFTYEKEEFKLPEEVISYLKAVYEKDTSPMLPDMPVLTIPEGMRVDNTVDLSSVRDCIRKDRRRILNDIKVGIQGPIKL